MWGGFVIEASDSVIERFKKAAQQGNYNVVVLYNGFLVRNGENVYLYQSGFLIESK